MKLFLTSVGLEPEYTKDFLDFLGKDPNKILMAHIPTACDPEPDKSYVKQTVDEIKSLGIEVYDVDLKRESYETLSDKLSRADVILVGGGNTYYLLDWARRSGFDRVIKKLVNEGKIYFGVSAGSLIACPNIDFCSWHPEWDDNISNIKDTTGFGFVDFVVSPHFIKSDQKIIDEYSRATGTKVVTLTDKQAVLISDDYFKRLGEANV